MPEAPASGRFIVLEGGEGAGKTTQVKALAARLSETGVAVDRTREPGGTPGAEAIRSWLLSPDRQALTPLSEALMHYAARMDHAERRIMPALGAGTWVLCDRFADSTTCYQGHAAGASLEMLLPLRDLLLQRCQPDLVLVLDIAPATGLARARGRGGATDRYEAMDLAFHQRLRAGFLDLAARDPERYRVISADQDADMVSAEIWAAVEPLLETEFG